MKDLKVRYISEKNIFREKSLTGVRILDKVRPAGSGTCIIKSKKAPDQFPELLQLHTECLIINVVRSSLQSLI